MATNRMDAIARRSAHLVRRGRWLARLTDCAIVWTAKATGRRLLQVQAGVALTTEPWPTGGAPVPPGWERTLRDRQALFDVPTYDRLRVLTTELRRLVAEGDQIEVRFGPRAAMDTSKVSALLAAV